MPLIICIERYILYISDDLEGYY